MTRNEERVLRLLQRDPMTLMALLTATQMETGRLTSVLADMRRRKQVAYVDGKWMVVK